MSFKQVQKREREKERRKVKKKRKKREGRNKFSPFFPRNSCQICRWSALLFAAFSSILECPKWCRLATPKHPAEALIVEQTKLKIDRTLMWVFSSIHTAIYPSLTNLCYPLTSDFAANLLKTCSSGSVVPCILIHSICLFHTHRPLSLSLSLSIYIYIFIYIVKRKPP